MSKLHFFRHAQASYLSKNYDQLSPLGEQQAAELGKYLVRKKMHFDQIYVGPLRRQIHTYEIVRATYASQQLTFPEAIIMDELRENRASTALKSVFSEWTETIPEVKKWRDEIEADASLLRKNSLLIFQHFIQEWADGNIHTPSVESWDTFTQDVKKGVDTILANTQKGEAVAAFTSGGTISTIAGLALHIENQRRVAAMNLAVRNTSFSSFLYSKDQFNLLSFNELPHLEDEMITFV